MKKKDVNSSALTSVEKEYRMQLCRGGIFPLMTNILSGAKYKYDLVKICMLLMIKTLSGAKYLSEVWMQIYYLN